jgi:nifR3 family TIM-barrel protein
MAGIGDPPYRRLCRRGGASLVCAEMVSANALHYGDDISERMLKIYPDEHPVSLQIFGSEPDRLAEAARRVEAAGADIVDLNCGCPVPKITKTGAGISLMKDESLFARCVEAMVRAVRVPVTVKMRLGFRRGENRAVDFARRVESLGGSAVTVHARAQEDRHGGPPDLDGLAEVVRAVKIPVFGNGGVASLADAERMRSLTGCAGVLVGQAAVGNPFFFMELRGGVGGTPDVARRFTLFREHARLITDYYGESLGVRRLRKYTASYVHALPGAAAFRHAAVRADALSELFRLLDDYEATLAASRFSDDKAH